MTIERLPCCWYTSAMKKISLIVILSVAGMLVLWAVLYFTGVEPVAGWSRQLNLSIGRRVSESRIAHTERIGVNMSGALFVSLVPSASAAAGRVYQVDLLEKGQYRAGTTVSWNQPEINVLKSKIVTFPLTKEENSAYFNKDVSAIFAVYVH